MRVGPDTARKIGAPSPPSAPRLLPLLLPSSRASCAPGTACRAGTAREPPHTRQPLQQPVPTRFPASLSPIPLSSPSPLGLQPPAAPDKAGGSCVRRARTPALRAASHSKRDAARERAHKIERAAPLSVRPNTPPTFSLTASRDLPGATSSSRVDWLRHPYLTTLSRTPRGAERQGRGVA